MVTPLDYLNSLMEAMTSITTSTGGQVLRATNADGVEVFVHLSPPGEVTEIPVTKNPIQDLYRLKMMLTPTSGIDE